MECPVCEGYGVILEDEADWECGFCNATGQILPNPAMNPTPAATSEVPRKSE